MVTSGIFWHWLRVRKRRGGNQEFPKWFTGDSRPFQSCECCQGERELAEAAESRAKEECDQAKVDLHLALKQAMEAEGAKTANDRRIRELKEELERCIAMSSVLADRVKHYEARAY